MIEESSFHALIAIIVVVFFGFFGGTIYVEKITHLECVALLKDKPAIEILGVCK